jgi:nucleotide-binding universal stress UspA family protein
MLKSLLIGLDGTADCEGAVKLGVQWAKRYDALAAGIAVIDEPGIQNAEKGHFGSHRADAGVTPRVTEARLRATEILHAFARRCESACVGYRTLEALGSPVAEIREEAQRFDVILLGSETHFAYGWHDEPDETLGRVLRDGPRPVIVVPREPAEGDTVLVAYDGSLQAARAVAAFEASGLGRDRTIHVVSISPDLSDAAQDTDRAVEFLRFHGLNVLSNPIDSSLLPEEIILRQISRISAGLVVMGAYGQPVLKEFFLGSVTRSMLKECPAPLFLAH